MKAQYQTYIGGVETFNNILALNGLCDRDTVRYLQAVTQELYPQTFSLTALDLGAGHGVAAMTLAQLGFNVAAYDMHRNSISILQKLAMQQDLNISFGMGGIFHLESLNKKFDLIHDGGCLASFPTPAERALFLHSVKNTLVPDGKFVLTSIIAQENVEAAKNEIQDAGWNIFWDDSEVLPECKAILRLVLNNPK